MRRLSIGVVLALSAMAVGCGSKAAPTGADGGDAAVEDAPDVAQDVPAEAPPSDAPTEREAGPPPKPATFVFTNSTASSIYIQLSGLSGQAYWSMAQGGRRLPVNNRCELCDCSECPYCAICGRSLGRVKELKPGEHHQWPWDGRVWELVTDACQPKAVACEQDQAIAAGAELQVDVTYSYTFAVDPSFGGDDQFIGTPLVAATAFTHAPTGPVEIIATP